MPQDTPFCIDKREIRQDEILFTGSKIFQKAKELLAIDRIIRIKQFNVPSPRQAQTDIDTTSIVSIPFVNDIYLTGVSCVPPFGNLPRFINRAIVYDDHLNGGRDILLLKLQTGKAGIKTFPHIVCGNNQ